MYTGNEDANLTTYLTSLSQTLPSPFFPLHVRLSWMSTKMGPSQPGYIGGAEGAGPKGAGAKGAGTGSKELL